MLIDLHSHMNICKNSSEMILRAKEKNVLVLTCGVDSASNKIAIDFSKKFENVCACLGFYPSDALKVSDDEIAREIKFLRKSKDDFVAIGEVGIDLKENFIGTLSRQKDILSKFVLLAKDLNKPVVIHSRKAEKETIEFLEEIGYEKIIMHCFCGKKNLVKRILENGWFITIPTSVKNSVQFQEIIQIAPIEQLFCETDSPFLHPNKKFPNEPVNVVESYNKIAEIKKLSLKEVENQIENNYRRLFG